MTINRSAEDALKRDGNNTSDVRLYADRSGVKGMAGAAVVLY
jgi:hypothetical protein